MAGRDGAEIAVPQSGLAELVGVSRVTVGTVLRNLQASGAIAPGYRRITVTDLPLLRALGDPD